MSFQFNHKNIWHWIGTFFGVGLMRPGPGTWGTLAAIPFGLIALLASSPLGYATFVFFITYIGFIACDRICENINADHDPKEIVIDEVAGMLLALSAAHNSALDLAISFCLFRLLDIFKPLLIGWIDQNKSGATGIMGDDLVAGFITAALLTGMHYAGLS